MKYAKVSLIILVLVLMLYSCATTSNDTSAQYDAGTTAESGDDEVYTYYTVPQRSDNLVFTIYTEYTFPSKKNLSDDESTLMALAFLFGMEYCSSYGGQGDNLAVAFMYDNNTAKTFVSTYKDYRLYADGTIDTDEYWERVSIEEIEY
jgi:hypothetical protein